MRWCLVISIILTLCRVLSRELRGALRRDRRRLSGALGKAVRYVDISPARMLDGLKELRVTASLLELEHGKVQFPADRREAQQDYGYEADDEGVGSGGAEAMG